MSDFAIKVRNAEPVHILELQGFLDAHTAPKLEETFQDLIDKGSHRFVVNCKELSYISSAGLGVFMAFVEDLRERKGDIKFSNMSPKVFNVFDLLGFPLLYDILKSEDEAIEKFSNTGQD
jgi:anti-sigma B factor antagonist